MSLEYSGLRYIEQYTKERIEELHLQLEAPLDEESTNIVRGMVKEARNALQTAKRVFERGDNGLIHGEG